MLNRRIKEQNPLDLLYGEQFFYLIFQYLLYYLDVCEMNSIDRNFLINVRLFHKSRLIMLYLLFDFVNHKKTDAFPS